MGVKHELEECLGFEGVGSWVTERAFVPRVERF